MGSSNSDISLLRLQRQMLFHSSCTTPHEVVRRMVAIQAQDYYASLLAIGLRLPPSLNVIETKVEEAITHRKIVRTWPMRGTLHFVAAEDVRWMLQLLTPKVIKASAKRYRELELDEKVFKYSRKLLEISLQGGKQLVRKELYDILQQAGISTHGQRGMHIIGHLAMCGVICFGKIRDKQQTFTLLDEWLPHSEVIRNEEALAELTLRYFRSRGPATEYDLATWSGLKVSEARNGIAMVQSNLAKINVNNTPYWMGETSEQPASIEKYNKVLLLPAFDEMLCGYKDRSAVIPTDFLKSTILKNGIISPSILVDGKLIGIWRREMKQESAVFERLYFKKPTKLVEKEIIIRAESIGKFWNKEIIFKGRI